MQSLPQICFLIADFLPCLCPETYYFISVPLAQESSKDPFMHVNRGLLLLCIDYSVLLPEIGDVRNLDKYIVPLLVLPMLQFPIPSIVGWPS